MTKVVEAIYSNGVLTPVETLELAEQQRVRITVESLERPSPSEREAAMKRFRERTENSDFRLNGPLPTRDELHERG